MAGPNETVVATRNLAFTVGARFESFRFLIRDRGPNFTRAFDAVFQANGTRILRTAVQAPRMNATCERLIGSLRRELLDRMLVLGEAHLLTIPTEYQGALQLRPAAPGHCPARPRRQTSCSLRHLDRHQHAADLTKTHLGRPRRFASARRARIERRKVLGGADMISGYRRAVLVDENCGSAATGEFWHGTGPEAPRRG